VYATAAVALAEGLIAAADGEREVVLARFRKALVLLEEQRLQVDLGEARIAFARALRDLGQIQGAVAEFDRAREVFARMEAVGVGLRVRLRHQVDVRGGAADLLRAAELRTLL